ncbi:hypothetical protein MUG91_G245n26 [Manis pentadactyla]|nr:hypothetical protein MUG91_G245n26 [Manis pentadactyla]
MTRHNDDEDKLLKKPGKGQLTRSKRSSKQGTTLAGWSEEAWHIPEPGDRTVDRPKRTDARPYIWGQDSNANQMVFGGATASEEKKEVNWKATGGSENCQENWETSTMIPFEELQAQCWPRIRKLEPVISKASSYCDGLRCKR